ncbi:MAG TPA: M14 family zinc carboxypeptidase [Planctomycetota bacterium]|nr:M14 family zinc carboxypeptidase [Planctomycetota bacterium]
MTLLLATLLQSAVQVDTAFPGGNAVVEAVEGDEIRLRPDLRDTAGDWFYWHVRVRGAGGRTLTFRFSKGNPVGVLGPAVSLDGGATWAWAGKEAVDGPSSFRYAVPAGADDVRFCMSIPYLEKDLRAFLERHRGSPFLKSETLCTSKKGRPIERLRAGRVDAEPLHRVLLTARHHACEMIASYVLEGILEQVLADDDDGRRLRETVEFCAIPFMDKDGVEDGDQGKNRTPRDHNRDYDGESVHPSTRALRDWAPGWADGKLKAAIDLHCPTLRGRYNETIYFVGSSDEAGWKTIESFSATLEAIQSGPLKYRAKDNLPFGQGWNTAANFRQGLSFKGWAKDLPGVRLASTLEISYANANGTIVTGDAARAFGRDMARALRRFLDGL